MSSSADKRPIYQFSPENVPWRHTQVFGVLAVPYASLQLDPMSIARFMRFGTYPLVIEDESKVALAVPYRKDLRAEIENYEPKSIYESEVKKLSPSELLARMGRQAVVLTIGEPPQPRIILSPLSDAQWQKDEEIFSEYLDMCEQGIERGEYSEDPENGLLIANRVSFNPMTIRGQFRKDMQEAQRRHAQKQQGISKE